MTERDEASDVPAYPGNLPSRARSTARQRYQLAVVR